MGLPHIANHLHRGPLNGVMRLARFLGITAGYDRKSVEDAIESRLHKQAWAEAEEKRRAAKAAFAANENEVREYNEQIRGLDRKRWIG